MKLKLKKLENQTIVITGATSGIGLTTARMAAENGANLVLVARNEDALRELADELNSSGARAVYAAGDVADENTLRQAARKAEENFGGFDTWVNNAGGSIYGRIVDVPTTDLRRLFETNVWGVVNGSKIAVEHLRGRGGAIINLGSEVSDAPIPLQGMYASSKHAVKGFTDALRMELEADGLPISVSLIKPTAIHTPFPENAKNYLPYEPQLPSPLYAPELVAEAILYCAENPKRDFFVGEMAKAHSSVALNAPGLFDKMNESMIDSMQNSGRRTDSNRPDGLYETNSNLRERGAGDRFVLEESLYQRASIHPLLTAGLLVGGGLLAASLLNSKKSKDNGSAGSLSKSATETSRTEIRKNMEVVGLDNLHIGTVDKVEGSEIKLTRKDSADGRHHLIPTDWVASVDADKVRLNKTATAAESRWRAVETTDADAEELTKRLCTGSAEV